MHNVENGFKYCLLIIFVSILGLHYPSLTNIIAKRIPIKDRTFLTSTIFAGGPVG